MQVKILKEQGYEEAILGLSLSFYDHKEDLNLWWSEEKKIKADKRAELLAFKSGGHNKFLESICLWIFIKASRDFWQEFDTYRVGMTKNSSSTMHTLDKREVTIEDFEYGTSIESINAFNNCLLQYKDQNSEWYKDVTRLKKNLPEGWLQERVICTNYMTLQNIIRQRHNHRLKQWKFFVAEILAKVEFPEFLKNAGD